MDNRIEILNIDNMAEPLTLPPANLIYADMIYENLELSWIDKYWSALQPNGIFEVQTDSHSNYLVRAKLESFADSIFVNHMVWKNEWGNHPKNKFHSCYDDIIIFAKGKDYKFYSDRIQVDKVTKNKGLNPSGRETKTATAWIDDICLTTTAKERIKKADGHLVRWQKPYRLFDRIVAPFTDEGDYVIDPFMGTAPLGEWCKNNNRNYVGIEYDKEIYELAKERLGM
jgi:site-specific DNA-methyltransferase (adenine-specific)